MADPASKEQIRKHFREKRAQLSTIEQAELNAALLQQLQQAVQEPLHAILSFCSLPAWGEPDAISLTHALREKYPAAKLAFPKIYDQKGHMEAVLPAPGTAMIPGNWHIPEPAAGAILQPEEIDLVLVPLLAFDLQGQRVGYGKGYYDRFLRRCRPDVIKLGISFFDPVNRIEDTGHFDVPLSRCITPGRLYEF
jgi:5-formyltetrahydrofolate cyclo-ligase